MWLRQHSSTYALELAVMIRVGVEVSVARRAAIELGRFAYFGPMVLLDNRRVVRRGRRTNDCCVCGAVKVVGIVTPSGRLLLVR